MSNRVRLEHTVRALLVHASRFWQAVRHGLDDKFGVPYGSGLPIALLALAVLMQYVALRITLARIFGLLN